MLKAFALCKKGFKADQEEHPAADAAVHSRISKKKLISLIAWCLIAYTLDALVMGLPGASFFCFSIGIGTFCAFIYHTIRSNKRLATERGLQALGCTVTILAVIGTFWLNKWNGFSNAETIIAAIQKYKAEKESYPDTLQDLVPAFLDAVPRAVFRFSMNGYYYRRTSSDAYLYWVQYPPFGRQFYSFETNKWRFMD